MWTRVATALTAALVCGRTAGVSVNVENGVYKLEESTFDTVIGKFPAVMVKFYAPWCGHCKKMAPDYEKAARKLKKSAPKAALAKVDATAETKLAEKYEAKSYPTLLVFEDGALSHQYHGGRDKDDMVSYMQAMVMEPKPLGLFLRYYSIAFGIFKEAVRLTGMPGGIRKYIFKGFPAVIALPFLLIGFCCMPRKKKGPAAAAAKEGAAKEKDNKGGRSKSPAPKAKKAGSSGDDTKEEKSEPKAGEEKKDD